MAFAFLRITRGTFAAISAVAVAAAAFTRCTWLAGLFRRSSRDLLVVQRAIRGLGVGHCASVGSRGLGSGGHCFITGRGAAAVVVASAALATLLITGLARGSVFRRDRLGLLAFNAGLAVAAAIAPAALATLASTTFATALTATTLTSLPAFTGLPAFTAFGASLALAALNPLFIATLYPCTVAIAAAFAGASAAVAVATIAHFAGGIAATATASAFPALLITTGLTGFWFGGGGCRSCLGRGRCRIGHAEEALEPAKEALFSHGQSCAQRSCLYRCADSWRCCWYFRFGRSDRCRTIRQHTLDDRLLLVGALLAAACEAGDIVRLGSHLVAHVEVVQACVVVLEALEFVVRCVQRLVGHQQNVDALLEFDLGDLGALLVQQEAGHFDGYLHQHRRRAVFQRLFLDHAQNLQRRGLRVPDVARATATRAGNGGALAQHGLEALATHFEQAKFADGAELHTCAVLAQRVSQAILHLAAVLAFVHVDEVDHDQATQIAQACLSGHFVGRFQVGAGGCLFNVAAFDGAGGVHVNRHQGFGLIDHNGAPARQRDRAAVGGFDLVFNLETAEQRCVIAVALDPLLVLGHDVRHELVRLLEDVVGIDQDLADVTIEIIANGADDQARFLVDQEGTFSTFGCAINGGPQFQQVIQIPLQFGGIAANAGGAGNDAHAIGIFKLVQCLLQFLTVFPFNASAHATASRVVGHQHNVAASQADKGGQGCALVATFFFFNLHQERLAFFDDVVDACLVDGHASSEILAGNLLERQEAVAVFTVVNKAGFKRRLHPGHDGLIDIAFALLAPFNFDFVVEQFLPVHDRQAAFFSLRGVDQHPFHDAVPWF